MGKLKQIFLFFIFFTLLAIRQAHANPITIIWTVGAWIVDYAWLHPFIAAMTVASIAYSLSQRQKTKPTSSRYGPGLDNTYSNAGILPLVYGGPLVMGGNIIWQSEPGITVQRFLAISAGEVSAISNVKLDDQDIADFTDCSYTAYLGTSSQTVDSRGAGTVKGLRDVAYVAVTLKAGEKVSSNSVVTVELTGRKIQTWNSTSENWTANAVNISKNTSAVIRDYLILSQVLGGAGLDEKFINNASFGDFFEHCAEEINNGSGGTEPRYELDLVIDEKGSVLDNLSRILITCNASLIKSGT